MMGKKIFVSPVLTCLIILLILAVLIILTINLISASSHKEFISSNQGLIVKTETRSGFLASMPTRSRQYTFSNGNNFRQEQVKFKNSSKDPVKLATYTLPGQKGTIVYYNKNEQKWVEDTLQPGTLPEQTLYLIANDNGQKSYLLLSQPLAYRAENDYLLQYISSNNGYIEAEYSQGKFYLHQMVLPSANTQIEYWSLSSSVPLIDWSSDTNQAIWAGYLLNDENRFNYDGYYYDSNEYAPPTPNSFKLTPSAYVTNGMIQTGGSLASEQIGIAMLDILQKQQNSAGYFPSQAESIWLKESYNLGGNYYDTRFCTDLAHTYLIAYQKFGIRSFYQTANQYGQFFLNYAQNHHFSLSSKDSDWLIEDYWQPKSSMTFHASLNHQLKEILFLYDLASTSQNNAYTRLANKMLNGLKHTTDLWILPDHNLNYAFKADGSSIGSDYPYLTYNDLLNLQNMLFKRNGKKDADLQKLLDAKKQWMKDNQVTGYVSEQSSFQTTPSQVEISIDGQKQIYTVYNIRGHNYFRLRDLACALNSTAKPCDLKWEQGTIKIIPGQNYSGTADLADIPLEPTVGYIKPTKIFLGNTQKYLTTYNINNYTYFKLRNIAKMLDIGLTWQDNQIFLDSNSSYDSEF